MKRAREDNTVGIIQRAVRHFRIPVMKSSVKEALKSHPAYPTFKCICDTLNEWSIEHYPLRYKSEELQEIKPPYIIHFNSGGGQIGFVTKIKNNKVTYYDSYQTKRETGFDDFIKRTSGAVIMLNPDERSGEKNYREKWQDEAISNSILPGIVLTFLTFMFLSLFTSDISGIWSVNKLLILTKVTGLILSLLLVLQEFEVHTSVTDKICHLNKATSCTTVLNDKASKIFGWFGWADAGFIYFTAGLSFLLTGIKGAELSLLAILSALSLPYPLFSIYYQGFVLKKWCPFCVAVQLVLIAEFVLLMPAFSNLTITISSFSTFILISLITGIIYSLVIMFKRESMSNEVHYYKYLGFRRNPQILRALLLKREHYEIPVTGHSLIFGQKESNLQITAFLSMHCSHCSKAFEKIREILQSGADAAINIVLAASDSKMLNALCHFKSTNQDNEAIKLLAKWYSTDSISRKTLTEGLCLLEPEELSQDLGNENQKLFKECNVFGTPAFFINGFQLPNQYDIDDIKYLSEIFNDIAKVKV